MSKQPTNRRTRSTIIVAAVVIVCLGALIYAGWAIFKTVNNEHISISANTLKLMFLGLVFGLLGVLFQRVGRKKR